MMDLREQIDNAAREVAKANNLTGHGQNSFKQMVRAVFDRVESSIAASFDDQASAKVQAERERITTILDAPEAKGREDTARRLALSSDIRPEQAIEILSTTPKTGGEKTPLDLAMEREGEAAVRDSDGTDGWSDEDHAAHRILTAGE